MRNHLVCFLFILTSCKPDAKENGSQYGSSKMKAIENLVCEIDSVSTYEFYYFDYGEVENKEFLYVVNPINYSVDVYSLDEGKVQIRFPIPREGPAFVSKPQGLLFHSPDSIFVFPAMMMSNITMFDHKGELKHHFKVKQDIEQQADRVVNHASLPSLKTLSYSNQLLFTNLTKSSSSANPDFFELNHPNFKVDLKTDSLIYLNDFNYPAAYSGKYWPMDLVTHSNELNRDHQLVTSWAALDSLIVKDLEGNEVGRFFAGSKLSSKFDFGVVPLDREEQDRALVDHVNYIQVRYDKFRDLYYRIATLPRTLKSNELLDHTSVYKNDFCVIVLDADFNFLEEVRFPGGIHHPYLAFVGQKGLYLSRANPYNNEINENSISFDVFLYDKD